MARQRKTKTKITMTYHYAYAKNWKKLNHAESFFLQDKFLLNENISHEDSSQYFTWQVLKDLVLVFFILITISFFLKFLEISLIKPSQAQRVNLEKNINTVWDDLKNYISPINTAYAASNYWQAQFEAQSHTVINIKPGKTFTYTIKFKNTGTQIWENCGTYAVGVKSFNNPSPLHDTSWADIMTPALMSEHKVEPGEVGTFKFILKAPEYQGLMEEKFVISAGNSQIIDGTKFNIPFNVTENTNASIPKTISTVQKPTQEQTSNSSQASTNNTTSNNNSSDTNTSNNQEVIPEQTQGDAPNTNNNPVEDSQPAYVESITINQPQNVRVGLYYTLKPISITANKAFYIQDGFGQVIENLTPGQIATVEVSTNNEQYYLSTPGKNRISLSHLNVKANEANSIFTITSLENRPSWNTSLNFNQFRNSLEVRYAPSTDRLWIINELSMEEYISGSAETSNVSHIEYHKTMAIAARSYALYHYNRGTKHASENFTVDATYDQVYKGYTSESVMPRYAQAVRETEGQVVTYNGNPVITPYFSQSDGRTRNWTEVWYGSGKEWLASVSVPQDAGKPLLGHGVGLSAWGALRMATYENKTYDQILSYFYTGTQIHKIY